MRSLVSQVARPPVCMHEQGLHAETCCAALASESAEPALPAGNVIVDACYMDTFSFSDFDMRLPSTVPVSEVARQASTVPSD